MKKAIFTMGLPGSGKTYLVKKHYGKLSVVDPDFEMVNLPSYNGNPSQFHAIGKALAIIKLERLLNSSDNSVVYDSTGTDIDLISNMMLQARANGFTVCLVFADCSIGTAIRRNALRSRTVPEDLIFEKSAIIGECFNYLKHLADEILQLTS